MAEQKCPSCGATSSGRVCTYCGSRMPGVDGDSAALEEYFELVRSAEDKQLEELLTHGFIPKGEDNLIKAGLACVPLLDSNLAKDEGDPAEAAVKRLRAIISQLNIQGESEKSRKAVIEFEQHVEQFLRSARRETLLGCVLLTAIAAGIIVSVVWWILS